MLVVVHILLLTTLFMHFSPLLFLLIFVVNIVYPDGKEDK